MFESKQELSVERETSIVYASKRKFAHIAYEAIPSMDVDVQQKIEKEFIKKAFNKRAHNADK